MALDTNLYLDPVGILFVIMALTASSFTSMILSVLCAKDCGVSEIKKSSSSRECKKEHHNKLEEDYRKIMGNPDHEIHETLSEPSFPLEAQPFYALNKEVNDSDNTSDDIPAPAKRIPVKSKVNKANVPKFLLPCALQGTRLKNIENATKDPKDYKKLYPPAAKELQRPALQATKPNDQDEICKKHLKLVETIKYFPKEQETKDPKDYKKHSPPAMKEFQGPPVQAIKRNHHNEVAKRQLQHVKTTKQFLTELVTKDAKHHKKHSPPAVHMPKGLPVQAVKYNHHDEMAKEKLQHVKTTKHFLTELVIKDTKHHKKHSPPAVNVPKGLPVQAVKYNHHDELAMEQLQHVKTTKHFLTEMVIKDPKHHKKLSPPAVNVPKSLPAQAVKCNHHDELAMKQLQPVKTTKLFLTKLVTKDPKHHKKLSPPAVNVLQGPPVQAIKCNHHDELAMKQLQHVKTTKHLLKELMEKHDIEVAKEKDTCAKDVVAIEKNDPIPKNRPIEPKICIDQRENEFDNFFAVKVLPPSTGLPCQIELVDAKCNINRQSKQFNDQHKFKTCVLHNRRISPPLKSKKMKPNADRKNALHKHKHLLHAGSNPEPEMLDPSEIHVFRNRQNSPPLKPPKGKHREKIKETGFYQDNHFLKIDVKSEPCLKNCNKTLL